MADDLAAWLTQIWDERQARIDATRSWASIEREADGVHIIWKSGSWDDISIADYEKLYWSADAEREVLARIAADRQILALHQPFSLDFDRITGCKTCSYRDDYEELQVAWPCPTLRLLAQPYADRPGYQEEWRPA